MPVFENCPAWLERWSAAWHLPESVLLLLLPTKVHQLHRAHSVRFPASGRFTVEPYLLVIFHVLVNMNFWNLRWSYLPSIAAFASVPRALALRAHEWVF